MPNESALVGKHAIVPLPFDSTKLRGLSERLIRSHHENNDGGAVAAAAKYIDVFFKNINWDEVNSRLERAEKAAAVLCPR